MKRVQLLAVLLALSSVALPSARADSPGSCSASPEPAATSCQAPAPEVARAAGSEAAPATAPAAGGSASNAAAPYHVLGRTDAPVSMVEFSDLQCPFCARYALQIFPEIKRAYIDTGKVRYAATDFPLPSHPYAVPAAVAARCAGEQGKFWEYRDAAFAAQGRLGFDPFDELAGKLGLDVAGFMACRSDPKQQAAVLEEAKAAAQSGIVKTPSFMIGRQVDGQFQSEIVVGAKPFEEFAAKIDALLREAGP